MRPLLATLIIFCATLNIACEPRNGGPQEPQTNPESNLDPGTLADPDTDHVSSDPTPVPAVCEPGVGRTFDIGPSQELSALADIDWDGLQAGDTVRIHWRAEPYRERLRVSAVGTADAPVTVCGVQGPDGQLPVLSGDNATTPSTIDFDGDDELERIALVFIDNPDYDIAPAHIVISGLRLERVTPQYSFTLADGSPQTWAEETSCLHVFRGEHITFRGNEIQDCENGVFASSTGWSPAHVTRDLLIEGNHIWGNGTVNNELAHNLYIEALGVTYQGNIFGSPRPGTHGANLKDRSAGVVIRYNHFQTGPRTIDLVEVQDSEPEILGHEDSAALYRDTFVYGNTFDLEGALGTNHIHYGWDSVPETARQGTLWFFHNTVMIRSDLDGESYNTSLFDLSSGGHTAVVYNNVVTVAAATPGAEPSEFFATREAGSIEFGANVWPAQWQPHASEAAWLEGPVEVTGAELLIEVADATAVANADFTLAADSPAVDAAVALPAFLGAHPVDHQLDANGRVVPRPECGGAPDMGAIESCD